MKARSASEAVKCSPEGKATLLETAPGVDVATVIAATEAELIVADDVREMPILPLECSAF